MIIRIFSLMIGGTQRYRLTNIRRVTKFSDDETALSGLAPLIEKSYYAGKSDRTSGRMDVIQYLHLLQFLL